MTAAVEENFRYRRRFPRRQFYFSIGVLSQGRYDVVPGIEIGEGGLLLDSNRVLKVGSQVVLNFFIPQKGFVGVTGQIAHVTGANAEKKVKEFAYGIKFSNLAFENKRMIRDYIAELKSNETTGESLVN